MKRRIICWTAGIAVFLMLADCHRITPPFRRADAVVTVRATAYCACMKCSDWRFNWFGLPSRNGKIKVVGKTSSGGMIRPGTVAADPKVFPPGTRFYISGYGWGIAEDTGGISGNRLDLYFRQHRSALKWGAQTKKVKVWYPRD